jgi:hypothetical protein
MALYGKSSWARLSLDPDTKDQDLLNFTAFSDWFGISAVSADIQLWDESNDVTVGINPLDQARLDVGVPFEKNTEDIFYAHVDRVIGDSDITVDNDVLDYAPFFGGKDSMMLSDTVAGFWFVKRKRIDLEDPESQKEALASKMYHKPFRILETEDKNEIKDLLDTNITADRKQNVVLIDFGTGRIYTDMTDDKSLMYFHNFLKSAFGIEIKATTLFFGPNETPWQHDFFKKILDNNVIQEEMEELVEAYLDDVKLAELREKFPLADSLYKKKKTYCQYSDDQYLVSLQVPATISDEKLKAQVGATDNLSCWEILTEIENWNVLGSDVVAGSTDGPVSWRTSVIMGKNLTQVFKNVELTKNFIDSHSDSPSSYKEHALTYLECLTLFEDLYVALVKRVLEIGVDDTATGLKTVSFVSESEE